MNRGSRFQSLGMLRNRLVGILAIDVFIVFIVFVVVGCPQEVAFRTEERILLWIDFCFDGFMLVP